MTPPAMSEDVWQTQVIDMAHLFGWRVHHGRPARTEKGWRTPVQGDKGFPDLVLARKGRVIIAELKAEKGRLSPEQEAWLRALGYDAGVPTFEVVVWRPSDRQEVEETLR